MSSVSEVSGGVSALLVEQQAPDSKKEVTADGAKVPKLSSSLETLKEILVKGGEKEAVLKSLSEVFGKKVIDKVLQLPMKIPGQMGRKECLELLVQVGQQVTLEDLEELFQEIKQCEGRGLIALSEIPTLRLWWNTSVRNLPEFWIAHLLRLFRDPLSFLEFERKLELQAQLGDIIEKDRDRAAVLYYEEQARTLGEKGNRLAPEFFYSYREILAKDLAYVRHPYFPIGSVVPVYDERARKFLYYVLEKKINKKGLHAYFLTPLKKGWKDEGILIFRGTQGYHSTQRDLDPNGIGKEVFEVLSNALKQVVEPFAKRSERPIITVIGHSLGAADGQRATSLLTHSGLFSAIELFAFCAPKLDILTVREWKQKLSLLVEEKKHPEITLNFAIHANDLVTWTGDAYLSGADMDFVRCNYLVVKSKSGIHRTAQHHTRAFFKEGNFDREPDGRTFELYQSLPKAEVEAYLKRLKERDSWMASIMSYFVSKESKEEIEARLKTLQEGENKIRGIEQSGSQHSWVIWAAGKAVNNTVQPFVYYTMKGINYLAWGR